MDSWKDELWTLVFVILIALILFLLYKKLWHEDLPTLRLLWVQWGMYASIAASFGIRTMKGFGK